MQINLSLRINQVLKLYSIVVKLRTAFLTLSRLTFSKINGTFLFITCYASASVAVISNSFFRVFDAKIFIQKKRFLFFKLMLKNNNNDLYLLL